MNTFMPDVPEDQRLQLLKENCETSEETSYYRDLTPDEIDIKREELTQNLIEIGDYEDELAETKERFKGKIKPRKEIVKALTQQVKSRKEMVTGTVFNMANHEDGVMETYDEKGQFISSRRLRPDEKQARLFPVKLAK